VKPSDLVSRHRLSDADAASIFRDDVRGEESLVTHAGGKEDDNLNSREGRGIRTNFAQIGTVNVVLFGRQHNQFSNNPIQYRGANIGFI
jgi:hypothetical protein